MVETIACEYCEGSVLESEEATALVESRNAEMPLAYRGSKGFAEPMEFLLQSPVNREESGRHCLCRCDIGRDQD